MERLYADRMRYLESEAESDCFLCDDAATDDLAANLVLARSELVITVINRYPYNAGHLMVAPRRHVDDLEELSKAELDEVIAGSMRCVAVLREALAPEGFNVGFNLGAAGGAGVPGHLHLHVVPRWSGDTNFMPVVGQTKVLPESLDQTYARLEGYFSRH